MKLQNLNKVLQALALSSLLAIGANAATTCWNQNGMRVCGTVKEYEDYQAKKAGYQILFGAPQSNTIKKSQKRVSQSNIRKANEYITKGEKAANKAFAYVRKLQRTGKRYLNNQDRRYLMKYANISEKYCRKAYSLNPTKKNRNILNSIVTFKKAVIKGKM